MSCSTSCSYKLDIFGIITYFYPPNILPPESPASIHRSWLVRIVALYRDRLETITTDELFIHTIRAKIQCLHISFACVIILALYVLSYSGIYTKKKKKKKKDHDNTLLCTSTPMARTLVWEFRKGRKQRRDDSEAWQPHPPIREFLPGLSSYLGWPIQKLTLGFPSGEKVSLFLFITITSQNDELCYI